MYEIKNCTAEDKQNIQENIVGYNKGFIKEYEDLSSYIVDENNNYIAGVVALRRDESVMVDYLFVDEKHRKSGYGTKLLNYIEEEAKKKNANKIILYTFAFQAPNFYKKLDIRFLEKLTTLLENMINIF